MVLQTARALAPGAWPLVLGTGAALVLAADLIHGRRAGSSIRSPWREAAALVATAVLVALFMGTRHWIKINKYEPRYLIPSAMLVQAALVIVIVEPLRGRLANAAGRRLPVLVAGILFLGVVWAYGFPSPRRVRTDLDRLGALTPDVLAAGCTHIAGDYWTVWTTVFHVNLTLYERGESRSVWGLTFRGQPTSEIWRNMPREERCVCIPVNDPFGDNWLLAFGLSRFRDVERKGTVRVLRWQPEPPMTRPQP